MEATEQRIRERVAAYPAAVAGGDTERAQRLRQEVAVLCREEVTAAATRLFGRSPVPLDDVVATAQLVFFETLPSIMSRFDPGKVPDRRDGAASTFARWVLREGTSWHRSVGKELGLAQERPSRNGADQQMLRLYHGCRERFLTENGRAWSPEEAADSIAAYLVQQTTERVLRKQSDLTEGQLAEAVRRRIQKDGHHRTLRQLTDIVRAEQSARTLSLDAPISEDGSRTLADQVPGAEDPDVFELETLEDWARVAVLGMSRKDARVAARAMLAAEEHTLPAEVARHARRNLVHPVAQFVVLTGVEEQFEPEAARAGARGASTRELLVAAAALG